MRKQIYGITLFIAIVSLSGFIYEYFSYSVSPDCTAFGDSTCVSQTLPYTFSDDDPGSYTAEDVSIRLEYVAASMRSQAVKARLDLEWQGAGDPPKALWVQLQFHNFDGSSAGWVSEPVRISAPFKNGDEKTLETSFTCERCTNLPRNLYVSATVWNRANIDRKLAYEINGTLRPVVVQE